MIGRRALLGAGAALLAAGREARAQSGLWPEWIGSYDGAARFYRSIPLEDIYPPPKDPTSTSTIAIRSASISTSALQTACPWSGCASTTGRCRRPTAARPCVCAADRRRGPARLDRRPARAALGDAHRAARPAQHRGVVRPCRRQLLAPPFHRALHADRRRRDLLDIRRRRHARPDLARLGDQAGALRGTRADIVGLRPDDAARPTGLVISHSTKSAALRVRRPVSSMRMSAPRVAVVFISTKVLAPC